MTKVSPKTIVGAGRTRFLRPGEKYHWVRETAWEREWEAEGLLPKRWAVASEPVVVETYRERRPLRTIQEMMLDHMNSGYAPWDPETWWSLQLRKPPGTIDPEK